MLNLAEKRESEIDVALEANVSRVLRGLAVVWLEFESALERVPLIERLNRGHWRLEDYQQLLCNLRQQVVDGSAWIACAASHIDADHLEIRSRFMRHMVTEHRDYEMLEQNYESVGGSLDVIRATEKNVGSEALSAWMFHKASQANPFDLLGAVFMIEGLGQHKAREWGEAIRDQLQLNDSQVSFLLYHGANDADHLADFEQMVRLVAHDPLVCDSIVKCAKVTGRLYRLQLEELGNR